MARNDGIDRTFARNQDLPTLDDVAKVQEHNEREKDSYSNQDIDTTQTYRNIHFKAPTDSYAAMFDQMIADGVISTRGLKADAVKYGELIFDVNSAYFHNHGGYEYAKQFYTDAYKAAVEIVGGEQYILSAVMHADERNRAMSEALGQDVYHYHLHVVYIPVVEKQILWSKRCKDKSLVGTVKETIMQVSRKLLKAGDRERTASQKKQAAELNKAEKRKAELDRLFAKMYEDWAVGRITEYNFNMLSKRYQTEQQELAEKIERLNADLAAEQQSAVDAEKWVNLIKQYVNPSELTAELLNALIEKIVVHEAVKGEGNTRTQEIEIYYRFIGKVE